MLQEVRKKLKELYQIKEGERLLVGVSGGADSVCLLLVLTTLGKEMDFVVEAVHVEHGIRGQESVEDAEFVENLCCKLQIACHTIRVDVPAFSQENGIGTEEAARLLRYQAFQKLAKERGAKIALAHHMEDNAETILFQLLRGSSLTGLCGMQAERTDEQGVTYIRPLLSVHREEIEHFLKEQGMEYRIDSTNLELDYSRNYIRNVIFPELKYVNAQAVEHITNTAVQLGDIREFLQEETRKAWSQVVSERISECGDKMLVIQIGRLLGYALAIQKEVAYGAIADMLGARKDVSAVHVEQLLGLCKVQSGKELHLPNDLTVRREYEELVLFYKKKRCLGEAQKDTMIVVSEDVLATYERSGEVLKLPLDEKSAVLQVRIFPYSGKISEIPRKRYTKWLNYDMIKRGFCIRTRRSGDAFISDACGHRKKLKQYFIDEKIPAAKRSKLWLLAQESTVLWLIGGRMSEHIKVEEDTKTIIEITYDGGEYELRERA